MSPSGQHLLIDGRGHSNDPVDGKLPSTPFAVQFNSINNGATVKEEPHPHQLLPTCSGETDVRSTDVSCRSAVRRVGRIY